MKKLTISFSNAIAAALVFVMFSGCYSFQGIGIPPDVNTFYVQLFENQSAGATPTLPRDFTERLKDKIRTETRLKENDESPDVEFSGSITAFDVTAEAPKAGETIGFNRLTISVNVRFVNHKNEKANWNQQFSFFDNFDASQNLLDVQEQLVDNISRELVERIFNKAFTNW